MKKHIPDTTKNPKQPYKEHDKLQVNEAPKHHPQNKSHNKEKQTETTPLEDQAPEDQSDG